MKSVTTRHYIVNQWYSSSHILFVVKSKAFINYYLINLLCTYVANFQERTFLPTAFFVKKKQKQRLTTNCSVLFFIFTIINLL